jgi:hypothetical protein
MRVLVPVLAARGAISLLLIVGNQCFCQDGPDSQDVQSKQRAILDSAGRLPLFNRPGRSLRQELFSSGHSDLGTVSTGYIVGSPKASPFQKEEELRQASCAADLIAIGTVIGRTSALSASETEVVTLYSFKVKELYKGASELVNKTIYVARAGGSVTTSQGTITQSDVHFPQFAIGTSYILFLAKLPGGNGFLSTEPDKSLIVDPVLLDAKSLPNAWSPSNFESTSAFRSSLDSALAGCEALPAGKNK